MEFYAFYSGCFRTCLVLVFRGKNMAMLSVIVWAACISCVAGTGNKDSSMSYISSWAWANSFFLL